MDRLELHRQQRGHKFFPDNIDSLPALYSTEDTPLEEKIVVLHYFIANSDWYICELDPATGLAFGYAILNCSEFDAEWGYTNLYEAERVAISTGSYDVYIERDLSWEPKPFGSIKLPWHEGYGQLPLEPSPVPQINLGIIPELEN